MFHIRFKAAELRRRYFTDQQEFPLGAARCCHMRAVDLPFGGAKQRLLIGIIPRDSDANLAITGIPWWYMP